MKEPKPVIPYKSRPNLTLVPGLVEKPKATEVLANGLKKHWNGLTRRGKAVEVAGVAAVAAVAIGVGALAPSGETSTAKTEYSFLPDIQGDQKQTIQIAEGMTATSLVAGVYAEEHLEGMPGPDTLEGPALVQAANWVESNYGTPTGENAKGEKTYNLEIGSKVEIPVITPDQAQHSFELNNQAFGN